MIPFGWLRALLFLLLLLPVSYSSSLLADNLLSDNKDGGTSATDFNLTYIIMAACFLLVVIVFRIIVDRKSFSSLGFPIKGFEQDAGAGFFTGTLVLSVGSLALVVFGYLHFTAIEADMEELFLSFVFFMIVAFSEELIFRGYLLNNLLDSFKPWPALVISALIFGLVHMANPGSDWLPILNIFIAGFLLGINYIYTRNLWFSMMFHLSWNFFQGPIYGFEVSGYPAKGLFVQFVEGPQWVTGGSFGFEGSVVATVITLLALFFFAQYYHKKLLKQNEVSKL